MARWFLVTLVAFNLSFGQRADAQVPFNANWIWADAPKSAEQAPAKKVWFRHEVRANQPSTGAVRIIGDDHFVLWINGQRIGEGGGEKLFRFNLNGVVGRGPNVIAIEATNSKGKAGLFVDGEIRGQSGGYISFDSGPQWKATLTKPTGKGWLETQFDTSDWKAVKVIGPHNESPWKSLELKETYLDRFDVAKGFKLERIAEPDLVGSIVAITWGNRGRLIASRERGPILSLIDSDDDGKFDKVVEFSTEVTNCQGLCMVFDDLYVVGNGPEGTGIYRLPDHNHDDKADEVQHVYKYKGGMGEHGPHDVVFGPDGWLYNNMGNHAWVTTDPESTTPVRDSYEGTLLQPKFEDARGHARGIKAPGGSIWRFTPDGKKWWCETAGFRNAYDFAINSNGDLFTFDSDMEWDVGMPWYRPIRVNHCTPGAEFGWRSGCAKWPSYAFDSLPGTVDIGRGSPTGVIFYEHNQFPKKYNGSFLMCDWSMGRIIAVFMEPDGATYTGKFSNLVTGNPLNVSDIDVDRDGSVVFSTGGRNTEGGIYRVTYADGSSQPTEAKSIDDVFAVPQILSAWARELIGKVKTTAGDDWEAAIVKRAKSGSASEQIRALTILSQFGPKPTVDLLISLSSDDDSSVRAFATFLLGNHTSDEVKDALAKQLTDENRAVARRACEAFIRSGIEAPVPPLLELLSSNDRWLRFAARLTLERIPTDKWKSKVLNASNPHVVTHGLLALHRLDAIDSSEALQIEAELITGKRGSLTVTQKLDTLRMINLTLIADGKNEDATTAIGNQLLENFPSGNVPLDNESARTLAALDVPGAAEKIVTALETNEDQQQQIHYALCLRYLDAGWDFSLKRRLLDWYEATRDWEGGHSFAPYLANIVGAGLERYSPEERSKLMKNWQKRPFATGLLIGNSDPEQVADFSKVLSAILNEKMPPEQRAKQEELVAVAIDAMGRKASPAAQQILRNFYDVNADRRDQLARALSAYPTPKNWSYLVRGVQTGDPTTVQLCVRGLRKTPQKPQKADDVRAVILAALRLGKNGGANAINLLGEITKSKHAAGDDFSKAVAYYRSWYHKKYPDAPVAELPKDDTSKAKYTFQQLFNFLEKNPKGRQGNADRGLKLFTKAKCVKCHRFLKQGETIGPDLTSVRRRFQRKEIIESLVYPSQVISDQYRMVTVVTVDGLVHNGMPVPGADDGQKIVLLLQDATKLEVPKKQIDEMVKSKVSVMPVGILKELTLDEIADLFAFLETSRFNELTPRDAKAIKKQASAGEN